MSKNIICVVGNPNCGKTTLFNALTGARQEVGNWPGVTVEKKVGHYTYRNEEIDIVDLPGIYSITPASTSGEDERVARDYILSNESQLVVNIVDASNLERNLYLTAQLIEMQVPMVVVVNMLDVAKAHQMEIRLDELQKAIGCPVVGIVASRGQGIKGLRDVISDALKNPVVPSVSARVDPDIRNCLQSVSAELGKAGFPRGDWFASQLLEGAPGLLERLPDETASAVRKAIDPLQEKFGGELDIVVADARYQWVSEVAASAIHRTGEATVTTTDKIDRVILNRWLGLPIFLVVMYVMFLFTQNLGGAFIDFFDILFGGLFVDGLGTLLESVGCPEVLKVIIADGIGGGIQTVSTFIPPVFFLFLFLAFLEDSGYMARAAFVMDRLMRGIGLPGKAFVPLIVGFGCNVPAIMATRTMDRASDRIITVLMAPFMSCGARLPVYVLFAAAFWPTGGQNLVFLLYIIGVVFAVLTGFLIKKLALPGEAGAFVMEIPPYHIPTFKGVMLRTWDRLKAFVLRAGKVIVVVVGILCFLNSWGTDGTFGNEDSDNSVLSEIGKGIVPILEPLGVREENWPAAVGVFTGILAKEAVIGTLNSLYGTLAEGDGGEKAGEAGAGEAEPAKAEGEEAKAEAAAAAEEEEEEGWSFMGILEEACQSVVDNLADLGGAFADPLGIAVDDLSDTEAAAEELEVETSTVSLMKELFGSDLAAFAYLLMVLLYVPCCAALAAIIREVGWSWGIFSITWNAVCGYVAATLLYRIGAFTENPAYSTVCIVVCAVIVGAMLLWLRSFSRKNVGKGPKVIPIRSAA